MTTPADKGETEGSAYDFGNRTARRSPTASRGDGREGEAVSATIVLECSAGCGKRLDVPRQPEDYPEAVLMKLKCPDCWDGDFDEPTYLDAAGKFVEYDPDLIGTAAHPRGPKEVP